MGERVRGIWGELRRRRVVSTSAAYLAVAFVVLQLAEILFPAFALGPGALRALFALLIAAFPIVLALSWVYDVTATGVVTTDGEATGTGPHPVLIAGVLASALALAAAGWWAVRVVDPSAAFADASGSSIAVLPFADMSVEGNQAYLGDGVAEEILNILAGVDGLQVAARTSSFAFRENDDIRDIASRLGVTYVLEGSVRRAGDDVRVTAQLIDAQSGFHLWSDTYDREVDDLFAVQDEIARSIAEALLGELDLAPSTGGRYVASAEAQELYYRGRAQWSRRDAVGIPEAIELFTRAIEADSLYAEAYAGLADSWALMPQFVRSVDAADAMDRAESLARRAIELNDDLAEPHASLGLVRALRQDRVGALSELGRAIELNGSYAPALHWRANVLAEMGRLREAEADAARAASVDPLSASIAADYAYILLWLGDTDAAGEEFGRAQSLDFGFAPALLGSALVALEQEQAVGLQMALTQWAAVSGIPPALASELATGMLAHRTSGLPQPAPSTLGSLGQAGMLSAGTVALLHALIGANQEALSWLEASLEDRSWIDQYLRVNPAFDGLRGEDGFEDILAAVGA
jgi:TolB-like protein/Flp pilus assembly protein TadD